MLPLPKQVVSPTVMDLASQDVENRTIEMVVQDGLCTGCGTCSGICPRHAIEMAIDLAGGTYRPKILAEECDLCGLCLQCCPGYSVDFRRLNRDIFGRQPDDALLGNYIACYTGHAADYELRYNSASGGLVTAVLVFALESGIIDGALVTRMSEDNPLEPHPFLARTIEEIIAAARSKYCPVPANVAIEQILREPGSFAVVGLPCHIQGIRKAEAVDRTLAQKICLHLGVFCGYSPSFRWTEFMLRRKGIRKDEVAKMDYRSEGWPGKTSIWLRNGRDLSIPYGEAGAAWEFFSPRRCSLCCDHTAELADISFGDAWLPELAVDRTGTSVVISRSRQGEALLRKAVAARVLELETTSARKAAQSQKAGLYLKKQVISSSLAFSRALGRRTPDYNIDLPKTRASAYLKSLSLQLGMCAGPRRYLWSLLSLYVSLRECAVRIVKRFR